MAQSKSADEMAFLLLARLLAGGFRRVGGDRPADARFAEVLNHRDFNAALQPLPQAAGYGTRGERRSAEAWPEAESSKKLKRGISKKAQAYAWEPQPSYCDSEGKGKGMDKGKRRQVPPAAEGPGRVRRGLRWQPDLLQLRAGGTARRGAGRAFGGAPSPPPPARRNQGGEVHKRDAATKALATSRLFGVAHASDVGAVLRRHEAHGGIRGEGRA